MLVQDLFENRMHDAYSVFQQLATAVNLSKDVDLQIGREMMPIAYWQARYLLGQYRSIAKSQGPDAGMRFLADYNAVTAALDAMDTRLGQMKHAGSLPGQRAVDETHDYDEPEECYTCRGTGEGQFDGTSCGACGGSGIVRPARDDDDFDIPYDYDMREAAPDTKHLQRYGHELDQRFPDVSNSVADRGVTVPNSKEVARQTAHPNKHHQSTPFHTNGAKLATVVRPGSMPPRVKRLDTPTTVPNFLKKSMAQEDARPGPLERSAPHTQKKTTDQLTHLQALNGLEETVSLMRAANRRISENLTLMNEAGSPAQQAAIAIAMKKAHKKPKNKGMSEDKEKCPPATQDITLNLKNRQKAIDEYGYGPLNPDMPNRKFWMAKQQEWNLDGPDEAKQSLCGNCAAFDQRSDTLDCIAQGIGSDAGENDPTIQAGDLGYCRFLKFKCASRRTCDAWVTGGPLRDKQNVAEAWSQKYKKSINCSHPKGFSQKAHCAGKKKHTESVEMEMVCEDCGMCETHGDHSRNTIDENCWKGYHKQGNKELFGKTVPNCVKNESEEQEEKCPHCAGPMFSELMINEKKDACYYKVKSRYKVWPSAYASGALVRCRKKGAKNWGSKTTESLVRELEENLHDWFGKEKWVRMDTKGNIKGDCAREPGEGKPKCLPAAKAHSLGKKGRASAAQRKRRQDPNPERHGAAINVATKEGVAEGLVRLREFAIDSSDGGGEEDILHKYARMWWAGDEATQLKIEAALARMGWEIGEDEGGYDNGGVFVVRAGDVNGDSYTSWAAEDLTEGVAEGQLTEYKNTPLQDYNGLQFMIDSNHPYLRVEAFAPGSGQQLAQVDFKIDDQDELHPEDLHVEERWRGQGIAQIMYDFVKSKGYTIHRSWSQTDAGAGFWDKHRGEERVWEQGVAEDFKQPMKMADYVAQADRLHDEMMQYQRANDEAGYERAKQQYLALERQARQGMVPETAATMPPSPAAAAQAKAIVQKAADDRAISLANMARVVPNNVAEDSGAWPFQEINELSNDKLAQYKSAAGRAATAADRAGNYELGNKRFRGITQATKKQFANDIAKHYDKAAQK